MEDGDVRSRRGFPDARVASAIVAHFDERGALDVREGHAVKESAGKSPRVDRTEEGDAGSIVGVKMVANALEGAAVGGWGCRRTGESRGGLGDGESVGHEGEHEGEGESGERLGGEGVQMEPAGGVRADAAGQDVSECRGGGDRGGGEGGHPRETRGGGALGLPRERRGSGIARGRRHVGLGASDGRAGGVARTRISRCRTRRGAEIRRGIPDASHRSVARRARDGHRHRYHA